MKYEKRLFLEGVEFGLFATGLLALALLLLSALPSSAFMRAGTTNSAGAVASCSYSTFLATDGCTGAPRYTNSTLNYYNPTAFTDGTFFQTAGQVNARNAAINWNVAGVDFPVGIDGTTTYCNGTTKPCSTTPGATNLIDAVAYFANITTNGDPAGTGCKSNSSVNTTTKIVTCKPTSNSAMVVNLNGFDFTPGDTDCLRFVIGFGGTVNISSVTFSLSNSRFKMNNSSAYCYATNLTTPTSTQSELFNFSAISAANTQPVHYEINNVWFDLQSSQSYMLNSALIMFSPKGTHSPASLTPFDGGVNIKYSYIANSNTKMLTSANCYTNAYYNAIHNEGWEFGNGLHTEWNIYGGNANCTILQPMNYINNTGWQDATLPAPATATFADVGSIGAPKKLTGTGTWSEISAGDFELNVHVTNKTQDAANGNLSWAATGANSAYTIANAGGASAYAVGDIVDVNVTYGAGPTSCRTKPQAKVLTLNNAGAGPGVGSVQIVQGGSCLSGASAPSVSPWTTTAVTGTGTGLQVSVVNFTDTTASAGISFSGASAGIYFDTLTIANNAIDSAGILTGDGNALVSHSPELTYCGVPWTFTNNFNPSTNAALTMGNTFGC